MAHPLMSENIWFDKFRYEDAEKMLEESKAQAHSGLVVQESEAETAAAGNPVATDPVANGTPPASGAPSPPQVDAPTPPPSPEQGGSSTLVSEIARAREHIQKSLSSAGQGISAPGQDSEIFNRIQTLETENSGLRKVTADLQAVVAKLESRIAALELGNKSASAASDLAPGGATAQTAAARATIEEDDDDDFVLFSDDDEKPQTQSPAKKDQGIKKENKRVDSSEDDDSDGDFGPLWDDDDDDDKPQTQSPTKKESKKVGSSEDDDSDGDFGPLWDDDDSPASAAPPAAAAAAADDDSDEDLFGSDSEDDAEAERVKAERVKAYQAKKAKKPALIAKSNIILDVKPWDDETDMKALEDNVRTIKKDGLLWGASKLVALAYGIKKLQISCVVEDDKVSVDLLEEEITAFEDFVQSVDIAAFNKV